MKFYRAAPLSAIHAGQGDPAGAAPVAPAELGGAVIAIRLADLVSPAGPAAKAGRTALVVAGTPRIRTGEQLVFVKVAAVAPAVARRDGKVQAGGHPADHARLGALEQQLDELAGPGVIDEIAAEATLEGKVKGKARRSMTAAARFTLVNEFLGYLANRRYSPRTVRAYAFDLLAFCRWLLAGEAELGDVTTETLLRYLAHCRTATFRGRPGGNVYSIRDGRSTGYAAATVNRRMAAISGLLEFRAMRDPDTASPVPKGAGRRQAVRGERGGLLGHLATARPSSRLRVRQPRRLPRGLDASESAALLDSFRCWRDKAIAGLMLLSGLRSAEVLALRVSDVDIPRGWALVTGKGDKERRVPVDAEVAGLIQTYLLAERPDAAADGTVTSRLFVVAKGPNRGRPLTPEGLRAVFRYHRERSGVTAGHPHALRHSQAPG